jgi:FPC/CPF motif-containing protein YcgG
MAACCLEFEKVANCHYYFFVLAKSWVVYGKKSLFFLLFSTRKIREQIRSKVSIYNCGIVSKELGFYGAEDNKEW